MSRDLRNNFKRLSDEDQMKDTDGSRLKGSISFISSMSRVIELYLPGIFQLMISIAGGGENKKESLGIQNDTGGFAKKDNKHGRPSEPPK